jgi:hypothetical protein
LGARIDYRELGSDLVIRKTVLVLFEEITMGSKARTLFFLKSVRSVVKTRNIWWGARLEP